MTKKILITCIALLQLNFVFADAEKVAKVSIEKATVYLQGAQLFSKANFNLQQGYNQLVFDGVSPYLDANSIQASGKGDFTIVDVQFITKYKEMPKVISSNDKLKIYQQQLILVEDSLENLSFDMADNTNKNVALSTERNLLLNNKIIKGETKKDSLNLLKESLSFLREKLFNIDAELLKISRQSSKLNKLNVRLTQRKTDLENLIASNGETVTENAKQLYQVIVNVLCELPQQATVSISYYCQNAGWVPQYELRASSDVNKIQLKQMAQVYQTTGVDWSNAELTLSTGNPNQSNILPTLSPYWLAYFQQYQQYKKMPLDKNTISGNTYITKDEVTEKPTTTSMDDETKAVYASNFVTTTQSLLRTDYAIKLKYNLPSDGKQHMVIVQTKELASVYEFSAVPKLDRNAFLMAKLFNWEELNLMQAQANVFFDGTYLGKTYINPTETNDTLELNVGRDNGIVMERKLVKDKSKDKSLAGERTVTKTYQVTIRNTKNVSVVLNLADQIPMTNDATIKVELLDAGGGNVEETTGELKWKLNLKAHENKKITFTYQVKSAVGKSLNVL
ncbi:MAG: hypothetical protein RIQ33_242 [Bacteroidota bacterium]